MACGSLMSGRRSMSISVTVLGVALCVVFLAYFAFSENNRNSTIAFTAVTFRHGERAPTGLYPNDPYVNYSWVGGLGSLLPRGSLQAYNLGTTLRKRYLHLMPSNGQYSMNNLCMTSSANERCLMSAQSFLAGFLPPSDSFNKLPIPWQPVAVNSIPRDRDNMIAQKAACRKYDVLLKRMYSDPPEELKEFNRNNSELFAYLTKHTGANVTSVHQGEQLYNILSIEEGNGMSLPEWTKAVYPEKLRALAERNLAVLTETDYMKRVKGGPIVTDIFDKMVQKANKRLKPDRSILLFSGHDVTLVKVMRALDVISQSSKKPDYCSALYFELHRNSALNDGFEVRLFYSFSSDDSDMRPLSIPDCDSPCSLTQFENAIKRITIRDFEQECIDESSQ